MGHLVGLSGLDANKCNKMLQWKHHADIALTNDNIRFSQSPIIISEFGDLKVTKIRQPQKCLSDDEINQAIAEYENGASTYELAEKYGCGRNAISGHLKKHGVNVTNGKITSTLDREQVISLYTSRLNAKQIAEKLNVKPQIIINLLRANNIPIRSRWDY